MSLRHQPFLRTALRGLGILLLAMGFAVLSRKYLLGALETRMTWLTYYPAVVLAALYGGWFIGLLSAVVSWLITLYAWPLLTEQPFIKDYGDQLGVMAFLFNCAMISAVAESGRRARVRADRAKELAEAANRAKSVFLANMNHELSTPLNAILGFSNLMRNDASVSPEQHQTLDIINRSGDGISREDQQRIFEPFVQLDNKAGQSGTGLGLAITRQFVELMGGKIRVESVPGKGAAFRIELPMELGEAGAAGPAVTGETRLARLAPGQSECRILIVEDQEENSRLLRSLLESAGFRVRVATNGAEGVAAFQAWRPHFIWMDWRMPVMDGLEATRRIRSLEGGRSVKIVALSASVLKDEREQVLAAGVDDFESKPIRFGAIYDCLTKHLSVRFSFTLEPDVSITDSVADLNREGLAGLPSSFRAELTDELVTLDAARIAEAVRHVAALNPALGNALAYHAGQFHYRAILQAVQPCSSGVPDEERTR